MIHLAAGGDVRRDHGWPALARAALVLLLSLLATVHARSGEAAPVYVQKDYAEMGRAPNTPQGICSAPANINSFVYLINHFPGEYGDTDLIADTNGNNVIDLAEQIAARDLMAWGWTSPTGISRPGIYYLNNGVVQGGTAERIWEATYWWFNDFAPGTSVLDGVGHSTGMKYWDGGSALEFGWPSWQYLWDSLKAGLDVELGLLPVSSGEGHAVTLAGLAFEDLNNDGQWTSGETPLQIGYLDPNKITQFTWADVSFDASNRIEFFWWQNGYEYYVYRAYTEGPSLIPGDATGDGWVDEQDAQRLAANWGLGDATWAMGDFDGDDLITASDTAIMAANWSPAPPSEGSAAVPEPSVWLLMLGVLPGLLARRRRSA